MRSKRRRYPRKKPSKRPSLLNIFARNIRTSIQKYFAMRKNCRLGDCVSSTTLHKKAYNSKTEWASVTKLCRNVRTNVAMRNRTKTQTNFVCVRIGRCVYEYCVHACTSLYPYMPKYNLHKRCKCVSYACVCVCVCKEQFSTLKDSDFTQACWR